MPKIVRFGFTWGNNILLNSILVFLAPKFRLRTSSDKGSTSKSKLNKNSYFGTEVITKARAQSGLKFDKKMGNQMCKIMTFVVYVNKSRIFWLRVRYVLLVVQNICTERTWSKVWIIINVLSCHRHSSGSVLPTKIYNFMKIFSPLSGGSFRKDLLEVIDFGWQNTAWWMTMTWLHFYYYSDFTR